MDERDKEEAAATALLAERNTEVAELRQKVADHDAECMALGMEIKALRDESGPPEVRWCNTCQINRTNGCRHPLGAEYCPHRKQSVADKNIQLTAFLASQGYTRAEDGTWGGGSADPAHAACLQIVELMDRAGFPLQGSLVVAVRDLLAELAAEKAQRQTDTEMFREMLGKARAK